MICDIANDFDLSAEFFVLLTLDEEALLAGRAANAQPAGPRRAAPRSAALRRT
jgi:hypothetical protein